MKVLLSPVISEKSAMVGDSSNQYVFKTVTDATKGEVKAAIEQLFEVVVTNVTMMNVKGKVKRFRNKEGKRNDWKKAYITLKEGDEIDLLGGADFS
ncbi:MAG: 50S ribosomal protein L23 [Gammaproteobacteria bacterium]|nr:50S ribosomal protein L23 [Gammaproteobacteria bacterium]